MDDQLTPPMSIVRQDFASAGERSSEDGSRIGLVLVNPGPKEGDLLSADIVDESTITFRRQPISSTQQAEIRLELDRHGKALSGDSDDAEDAETEDETCDRNQIQDTININDYLSKSKYLPMTPIMGERSLGYVRSEGQLKCSPLDTHLYTGTRGGIDYVRTTIEGLSSNRKNLGYEAVSGRSINDNQHPVLSDSGGGARDEASPSARLASRRERTACSTDIFISVRN